MVKKTSMVRKSNLLSPDDHEDTMEDYNLSAFKESMMNDRNESPHSRSIGFMGPLNDLAVNPSDFDLSNEKNNSMMITQNNRGLLNLSAMESDAVFNSTMKKNRIITNKKGKSQMMSMIMTAAEQRKA